MVQKIVNAWGKQVYVTIINWRDKGSTHAIGRQAFGRFTCLWNSLWPSVT